VTLDPPEHQMYLTYELILVSLFLLTSVIVGCLDH